MMSVDTALLLAAFVSLQAAFIYGRFKVFRIDGDTPVGVRLIEVSRFVCIALDGALIATRRGDSALLDLFGVVVALMSGALFAWGLTAIRHGELTAAFSRDVPLALIKSGPYGFIRNPFYLAYLLCYGQAWVASRSAWALLPLAWMTLIYCSAARQEEQKFLNSPLALEYRRYRETTGSFFPRIAKRRTAVSFDVRLIRSAAELACVQRQRYAIYVRELRYPQRYADAAGGTVAEPLDASGHIFGAFCDEGLVGSVRVNYGDEGDFGDYFELYGMDRFGAYAPAELCIVTKLMLLPAFRAGTLMARLSMAMYEHTRDHKPHMKFCLIDCIPPYEGYFERIGYRPIGPRIRHPAAGLVIPLAFPVYDLEHFGRIRSPLARVCPRHDRVSVDWFSKTFGPARDHGRSRILRHWRARQASGSQEIGALNQR